MTQDEISPQAAADALFFETESPRGFLARLQREHVFDEEGWSSLWQAVAHLVSHYNGTLDTWSSFDLARVVEAVQQAGLLLEGRTLNTLDPFEKQILAANAFLNEVFGTA